ncbi:MAG: N-acetyl-gamma-glutamyl-phosphate reductase [Chitinophagaceae bacterium]|nr:N-acetyl-gamma-glutamyl-phosphate reductase [Chitinophagaceae bacterium]
MQKKIKVGIIGGAGYTGGELIRILLNHPACKIVFVHSKSNAGNYLHHVHHDLLGETELKFSSEVSPKGGDLDGADVLFLCAGHGAAKRFLEENEIPDSIKIIDLSHDFRLTNSSVINSRNFIYGLPELNRDKIKKAGNVANPGCFATAIQLGLLPLGKEGLLKDVYTTGITGSTGAGQGLSDTSHFSWRANNIQPYKTFTHQHLNEVGESLLQLQTQKIIEINFIPWRGDFTRGIFISSQMHCDWELNELKKLYQDYYRDHTFTFISEEQISLKQAVNNNKCFIHLEKVADKLVVHSAIDNLLKGASGQAVQNMNLMFGLEETTGLKLKAAGF